MKYRIKLVGLVVVAALTIGSVAAAGASAHEFIASKTGEIQASGSAQTFKSGGGLVVECGNVKGTGMVTSLKSEVERLSVTFEKCKAAGTVTVKNATTEFEYKAAGSMAILKPLVFESSEAGLCTITIPTQSNIAASYLNISKIVKTIKKVIKVIKEIFSEAKGRLGSCEYSSEKTGTFESEITSELVGGNLEWA